MCEGAYQPDEFDELEEKFGDVRISRPEGISFTEPWDDEDDSIG